MSQDEHPALAAQVRVMQIIVAALAMGVVTFALLLLLVVRPVPDEGEPLFVYVGLGLGLLATLAGVTVPRLCANQMPATVATYQTTLIIGAALFEGAAFFNLIAYMIEGQVLSLVVAAILLLFMILLFPTVSRVHDWLESRRRREQEHEAFGSNR